MTHDEIKAMVCELFEFGEDKWFDYADSFIKLVEDSAAAEREACAKVCDDAASSLAVCPKSEKNDAAISALKQQACMIRSRSNV